MRSTLPAFNEVWQRQFRSSVLKQIQCFPPESTFLIGCSGGMDSMLLLYLMSDLFPKKIRTIYIDHQLQSISADWGQFVSDQCAVLNVPCIVEAVDVQEGNQEHQARNARYQAFSKHLKPHEILVLAHHQQDQAETLILRLLSGAGVHGLAAMKQVDVREQFTIWRPLLDISREQICQWAAQLDVQNIEDPTNLDTHYDRAWCRHELWPILQKRYSKMQQALSRTSYLMQDAEDILLDVLQQDLNDCGSANELDLTELSQLSTARQRQLLSAWMKGQDTYRPSFEMVERLLQEVIKSKSDAQAALNWNQFYYVRYQQKLFRLSAEEYLAEKNASHISEQTIQLELGQKVDVLSGQYFPETAAIGLAASLLGKKLDLVMRQGGEKIHLYGRVGAWPLKKAIQEAQIFPWQRYRIQILSIDNVMLGVFTPKGFWLAQSEYCEIGGWQPNLIS
ncbi:tRNA lysidine(34) synthetase TilS [Acinetobacter sp.]|uniref:tRNA lysidine(34) synthetase TilS n=1 Tax=Acinetobacter sp. TaxID=472 RepID=UPI00264905C1|nr:tRNA lysidine(34) synthetase TilS [Acinetobacter sp.]MDN5511296.1 tRNA lysidine(34) synthetase TilS [Acinetobacter sp.]MDN5524376.1 tRNA lysidine(34) synthetase TilS [Acinetobacter sp.]